MGVNYISFYRVSAGNESSILTDDMHLFLVKPIREGENLRVQLCIDPECTVDDWDDSTTVIMQMELFSLHLSKKPWKGGKNLTGCTAAEGDYIPIFMRNQAARKIQNWQRGKGL